jgi:carbamoyl-phosphate synthase small subunit
MPVPDALFVLEDGTTFRGEGFGAPGTAHGEVVFNTALTGYQEVLTDPSYHRQLVAMTNPQQGNYGVTPVDAESSQVRVAGFIVREASRVYSNHRATGSLTDQLRRAGTVGISEIDTRRLVRHIRSAGAMKGAISTEILDPAALLDEVQRAPGILGADLATEVSTPEAYEVPAPEDPPKHRVVAYDFGIKRNILRLLTAHGCTVQVVPALTPVEDVLALDPDGVFLSNGPGDPAAVKHGITAIAELLRHGLPLFGICLGHQLLGLAVGASTYKLPFGHHGTNQPVKRLEESVAGRGFGKTSARIEITSHNHGFAVDTASIPTDGEFGRVTQSHINLNDGVNEGLRCHDVPAFSVQYHPEAAPGPHDARYLFAQFMELMAVSEHGSARRQGQRLRSGWRM